MLGRDLPTTDYITLLVWLRVNWYPVTLTLLPRVHWTLVPRWPILLSFMPTLSVLTRVETKFSVVPILRLACENIRKLRKHFAKINKCWFFLKIVSNMWKIYSDHFEKIFWWHFAWFSRKYVWEGRKCSRQPENMSCFSKKWIYFSKILAETENLVIFA